MNAAGERSCGAANDAESVVVTATKSSAESAAPAEGRREIGRKRKRQHRQRSPMGTDLIVCAIPRDMSVQQIIDRFSSYGEVTKVQVAWSGDAGEQMSAILRFRQRRSKPKPRLAAAPSQTPASNAMGSSSASATVERNSTPTTVVLDASPAEPQSAEADSPDADVSTPRRCTLDEPNGEAPLRQQRRTYSELSSQHVGTEAKATRTQAWLDNTQACFHSALYAQ